MSQQSPKIPRPRMDQRQAMELMESQEWRLMALYLVSLKEQAMQALSHLSPLALPDQRQILLHQGRVGLINDLLDRKYVIDKLTPNEKGELN